MIILVYSTCDVVAGMLILLFQAVLSSASSSNAPIACISSFMHGCMSLHALAGLPTLRLP